MFSCIINTILTSRSSLRWVIWLQGMCTIEYRIWHQDMWISCKKICMGKWLLGSLFIGISANSCYCFSAGGYLWYPCSIFTPQPSGLEGIVITVWAGGWVGGCQTSGTHISVTTWRIFSVWSSVELSRPVVVHCHDHLPICPIWACPWAKNLSNQAAFGPDFAKPISLKPLDDLYHLKFYGNV